jgi:uncharacterized protein YcaQ
VTTHLSIDAARNLHLLAQGLLISSRRKATKSAVLATIRRMGLLQIDTINVVERSPYFVLWSRLRAYDKGWLEQLLAERQLFEYWAHEACFIPIEDYRLLRHRMLDPASMGWKYSVRWMETHRVEIERIKQHIRDTGPVRSVDFARPQGNKGSGWWDWKPEKRHLEVLLTAGELMVTHRKNFQRCYDLATRVLPRWKDERDLPSLEVAQTEMIRRSCQALGVVKAGWVSDYYRLARHKNNASLDTLVETGELIPVRVEGVSGDTFVHRDLEPHLAKAENGSLRATKTTLLSPFDPVVWDRKRAKELWNFDYRIECYMPAGKRRYGYFVLPILSRGKLVGRVDAKAHRKDGVFEIKALFLEPGVRGSLRLQTDVAQAIQGCANWHGTPTVKISSSGLALDFAADTSDIPVP